MRSIRGVGKFPVATHSPSSGSRLARPSGGSGELCDVRSSGGVVVPSRALTWHGIVLSWSVSRQGKETWSKIVLRGRLAGLWGEIRLFRPFQRELDGSAWLADSEVTVKIPRIRIAWVMFAIAFFAIDFTIMRALLDYPSPLGEELLFGALPMANVLMVGVLIAQQRPRSRPFFVGFEFFSAR
jgi:hypothetical protein